MKEQKKTIPLALALCVAAAVVNYSSLLGIITGLPRSFSGGVLGIIGYLANAVITFAPLAASDQKPAQAGTHRVHRRRGGVSCAHTVDRGQYGAIRRIHA
jgi:hypothetical protein